MENAEKVLDKLSKQVFDPKYEGDLPEQIYQKVALYRDVTFKELCDTFPDEFCGGNNNLHHKKFQNIIYWTGLKQEAIDALYFLIDNKLLTIKAVSTLVYAIDGSILAMNTAKKLRDYKTPRWLPIVFNANNPETGQPPKIEFNISNV